MRHRGGLGSGATTPVDCGEFFPTSDGSGFGNLVRVGAPERVVMAIGGWKTGAVFDRNIVSERDLHEAGAKVERHIADSKRHGKGTLWTQL